ncbi:MAG: PEP-CTERM sorting domain-containing protein [Planctomycetaceae bacterium]|nr:PEP-CTERM sorting domain-containing protein [Planctomycetaceae bacterium]
MKLGYTLICIVFNSLVFGASFYDIDFSESTRPYSVVFGSPRIQNSFGHISNNCLVFNPKSSTYEQIELKLGKGQKTYQLSFDIETKKLTNSKYAFTVLFDTPTVQTFSLHGMLNDIYMFNPYAGGSKRTFFTFSDNSLMHIDVDINLMSSRWSIAVNQNVIGSSGFHSDTGDIRSIRFALSPWSGTAGLDNSIYVGIDNILVTPEPATLILMCAGAFILRKKH